LLFLSFLLCAAVAAETMHIVVRGDTIFSLSRTHGVTQDELMQRNGLTDPLQLRIGMRLSIPGNAIPGNTASGSTARHENIYIVEPGETLFGISRNLGVSVQELRAANGFSEDRVLRAGDRLYIPSGQTSGGQMSGVLVPPITFAAQIPTAQVLPPEASPPVFPNPPALSNNAQRADPSLLWPIPSREIVYMDGGLGGVLILGQTNESVRSLSRGTVSWAGQWRGYGNVVIVESEGGFRFIYGANERLSVRRGDVVDVGTEVGRLGIHPLSGRPELVFIVSRNGIPVDPATVPRP